MTITDRPANPRPGRATRTVVYPAFTQTGPEEPVEGTRGIYLYLRLSKYHRDGADAIERQRLDLLRKLNTEGGWTVLGEYIDNDSASASAVRNRKGWRQLNQDIQAGKVEAVAFWKLDRTNRVASKCIEWIGQCQKAGVYLVSHQDSDQELNTATAGAKLITGIKALMAEVETDSMSERQLAAKRHLAEAGFHHGGRPPLGWIPGPRVTDEQGRTGVRLVPHPVEHPALKRAVELVLDGVSLARIADYWKAEYGITTAKGAPIYEATIYRALVSPRMVGYRMRQVPEHQRGVKLNLLDYIARDAKGDPVISQEPVCDWVTWLRVKKRLEESKTSRTRRPWGSHEWLLTGLVFCQCGDRLYGHNKTRRRASGDKYQQYAYRCMANRKRGRGHCDIACVIDAAQGEAHVLGWFFAQLTDESVARARAQRRAANSDQALKSLFTSLEEARAERDELLARQGSQEFKGNMVRLLVSLLGDVEARIETLQQQIDAMDQDPTVIDDPAGLVASWNERSLSQRRSLLRRLIRRIDIAPGPGPASERMTITPVDT